MSGGLALASRRTVKTSDARLEISESQYALARGRAEFSWPFFGVVPVSFSEQRQS